MLRMPRWRLYSLFMLLGSLGASPGCSESSTPAIDTKAALQKATGGDGKVRQSEKVKQASEEAAKKHPKLY